MEVTGVQSLLGRPPRKHFHWNRKRTSSHILTRQILVISLLGGDPCIRRILEHSRGLSPMLYGVDGLHCMMILTRFKQNACGDGVDSHTPVHASNAMDFPYLSRRCSPKGIQGQKPSDEVNCILCHKPVCSNFPRSLDLSPVTRLLSRIPMGNKRECTF